MRNRYYIIAALIAVMPFLASCRQELCYDHYPSVDVKLDWEQEWERDYGCDHVSNWDYTMHGYEYSSLRPDLPEWVNLVKFKKDGTTEDFFLNVHGGNVRIDNYKDETYLLYNGDTEYIVFEDMASQNDARATTSSRSRSTGALQYLMSMAAPSTRTVNPPDLLYGAYVSDLPQVGAHQKMPMPVTMQPLVYTYVIRYEFEHGLEHVVLARGALGGMAESVYMRSGITSDETAILLFDCEKKGYGCEAQVRTFGVPSFPDDYYGQSRRATNRIPVVVNLELRLVNGKYVEHNFDVTEQISNQPRGGVITIKGIRVEDEDAEGATSGAFDVDVSDWGEPETIPLPL